MTGTITPRKALELAVEAERIGEAYYQRVAARFADRPEIAAVFRKMAEDELDHQARFTALLRFTKPDPPDVENEYARNEKLRGLAVSAFYTGELFHRLDEVETVADALMMGAKFEEEAMKFYQGLRDVIGPGPEIDALVAEEKRHHELLTEQIKKHLS